MTCQNCRTNCQKFGKDRKGNQRFRCCQCYKTYSERPERLDGTNKSEKEIEQIVRLLVEGCSVRSIERIAGIHRDTILNVLVLAGQRCQNLLDLTMQSLPVRDIQIDEVWGFVGCKEGHNATGNPEFGDAYCFIAIERNTKIVITWHLGKRSAGDTWAFVRKLDCAVSGHFQATTDGWKSYPEAMQAYFSDRADYAQLIKVYASSTEGEHRYSPPQVIDTIVRDVCGTPDPARICTSHIERQNLSIRMGMRRMTRLTNAFSKKRDNLRAAYALWFAYYNFCRVHQSLRVTPAMQAGLSTHVWELGELLQAI
jgi:transposase-like protein/IS1 family transposase